MLQVNGCIVNDLFLGADDDNIISGIVRLVTAFDTMDNSILLYRLQQPFDIHDIALSWFQSCLTKCRLCVNGVYSDA